MSELIRTMKDFCESTSNVIKSIPQVVRLEAKEGKKFRECQCKIQELFTVIKDEYSSQVIMSNETTKSLSAMYKSMQNKMR